MAKRGNLTCKLKKSEKGKKKKIKKEKKIGKSCLAAVVELTLL